jgi:hypothetical protein
MKQNKKLNNSTENQTRKEQQNSIKENHTQSNKVGAAKHIKQNTKKATIRQWLSRFTPRPQFAS